MLEGVRGKEKGKRDAVAEKGVIVLPSHAVSAGITHYNHTQPGHLWMEMSDGVNWHHFRRFMFQSDAAGLRETIRSDGLIL